MASKPANANGHRRRQVRARVLAEETHCGICGRLVDKSLTVIFGQHGPKCRDERCVGCVPHPLRPEVDEIIPRKDGGSPYERSNCRLTCRTCNVGRNRKTAVTRPAGPLPIVGDW